MPQRTLFFVPVFNQRQELPTVLSEIHESATEGLEFLLVNNGSRDGSEGLIHESGFPFIDIDHNQGIGHSYLLALDWARSRDYLFFGTMASNGKMLPAEIPRLLEPLERGEADYVTGSRFLPGGDSPNLPSFRRRTIPLVNLVARMTTGAHLTDATNGFRVFRLSLIDQALFDLRADWLKTYGFEYYLYAKVLRDPYLRAVEVPSTMRYPAEGSYSKIRPGTDWWQMLKPWLRAPWGPGFSHKEVVD